MYLFMYSSYSTDVYCCVPAAGTVQGTSKYHSVKFLLFIIRSVLCFLILRATIPIGMEYILEPLVRTGRRVDDPKAQQVPYQSRPSHFVSLFFTGASLTMANLIKGYLPIRINIPSLTDETTEDTFIFVKEHSSAAQSSPRTLFVTNTPVYPSIQTKILLESLFERYADVERILVAPRPKKDFGEVKESSIEELALSMFEKEIRSFGGTADGMGVSEEAWYNQGRYAHVVFATAKDMKKFMSSFGKKKKKKGGASTVVKFGKLEIQELQDISQKLYMNEKKKARQSRSDGYEEESDNDSQEDEGIRPTGMMALVEAHKNRILSRDALKQMCNQIMANYEEAEADALQKQQRSMNEPDAEGFVTVSYSANVGDAVEYEKNGNLGSTGVGGGRRKRERTRSSKKNLAKGSDELQDFYRFQLKESKKRNLEELKTRFQDDLKRVKQMTDEKMYRPF